jgi:hypothetical protein
MPQTSPSPSVPSGVAAWHDRLLTLALDWRAQHPGFTFNLRTKESITKPRLQAGYWFTGSEQYLFFAPYRPGDRDNKTKTIGFVIQFDELQRPKRCYFELVFGNLEDPSLLAVHQQLRDSFEMQQVGSKQVYRHDYLSGPGRSRTCLTKSSGWVDCQRLSA